MLNFNDDNADSHIDDQIILGFRIPGTQAREDCANYFISKFKEIDSNFTFVLHNFTIHSTNCQNVLFKLNENQSNIVILGAHYDSRKRATKDPDLLKRNESVLGANDGASGSAVLIELAKAFYDVRENLSCQIWFLFFDAEDQGYDEGGPGMVGWGWAEGSKKFVNDIENFYDSQNETFDAMILLDLVGGLKLQFIKEKLSTSSLVDELFAVGRALGYTTQFPLNPASEKITDDHQAFLNIGIPSADLITKFWDKSLWPHHHTTLDDNSSITTTSLEATGRTVEQFIYNNYFNTTIDIYKGNYPWKEDIDLFSSGITITVMVTIAVAAIVIVIVNIIKTRFSSVANPPQKKVHFFSK